MGQSAGTEAAQKQLFLEAHHFPQCLAWSGQTQNGLNDRVPVSNQILWCAPGSDQDGFAIKMDSKKAMWKPFGTVGCSAGQYQWKYRISQPARAGLHHLLRTLHRWTAAHPGLDTSVVAGRSSCLLPVHYAYRP